MSDKELTPEIAERALLYLGRYIEKLEKEAKDPGRELVDCVRTMNEVFKLKEQVASVAKSPLEKIFDMLRFAIIPQKMDNLGISSLTVEGIGKCNTVPDVQLKQEDKEALQNWLIEHEAEDLLTRSINAQTLAAFIRNRIKEGQEIPPSDILKVTPIIRAQITKR